KYHGSGEATSHGDEQASPFFGPGPTEASTVLQQANHLQDNDIVIMGTKVPVDVHFVDDAAFNNLVSQAFSVSAPFHAAMPSNGADMATFFAQQSHAIDTIGSSPVASMPGATVITAPSIEGTYVNGVETQAAPPSLTNYLPEPPQGELAAPHGTIVST